MKKSIFMPALAIALSLAFSVTSFAYQGVHEVEKDETLWKISRKHKLPLFDVIESNPQFTDPDLIYPEDSVYIPFASNGKIGAATTDDGDGSVNTGGIKKNRNQGVASKSSSNQYEQQVAQLVNKERSAKGLPLLKLSDDISNIARVKSEDMRDSKYFDHTSPNYGSPFQMIKEFGISYKTAGENIAKGQSTPEAVMQAWMNSEGHKKNILNMNFTEIGVGYVVDSYGTAYWTQQFLTR